MDSANLDSQTNDISQDNTVKLEEKLSAVEQTHSSYFDEWTVAKPDKLQSPLLRTLAKRLQTRQSDDTVISPEDIKQQLIATDNADAAVLIIISNEASPQIMFTRRASHLNTHAGEVSFAGGKQDATDGNNVITALREACEETGLPTSRAQIIGQLPIQTSRFGLSVRPIVAVVEPDIGYVPELGEIERIFWGDFETLINAPTEDYVLTLTEGEHTTQFVTPSWRVDGEIVWGLTGRIFAELLEVGFDRQIDWYYALANK